MPGSGGGLGRKLSLQGIETSLALLLLAAVTGDAVIGEEPTDRRRFRIRGTGRGVRQQDRRGHCGHDQGLEDSSWRHKGLSGEPGQRTGGIAERIGFDSQLLEQGHVQVAQWDLAGLVLQ